MGKVLLFLVVFAAGYLWGDVALSYVIEGWQEASEAARFKFEEITE